MRCKGSCGRSRSTLPSLPTHTPGSNSCPAHLSSAACAPSRGCECQPAGATVVAPGELDHAATVDAYIAEMAQLGVGTYTAAPPFFRLFWGMGLRVPPPLFMAYAPLALITGSIFAVFWGVGMWLIAWRTHSDMSTWLALVVSAFAGLLFGLGMASYYRSKARDLPLPSWQNYLPPR